MTNRRACGRTKSYSHRTAAPANRRPQEEYSMSPSAARAASCALMLGLTVAIGAAGQTPQTLVPSGEGLPDGPGKDVTVKSCGTCHEARRAASVRLTRDGWAGVIQSMRLRGAQISDDDFPVILEYLSTSFLGEA